MDATGDIKGFQARRLPGDGIEVDALVGGSGPPLLLLHGWPQTRLCWAEPARRLMQRFTVVLPDLRGYGRRGKPEPDADHLAYSKRAMARDQIATMQALGFERFAVAGHDRGGRVAYRAALDHPQAVSRIAVLDIVPTAEVWAGLDAQKAERMWHWTFQIQGDGLPERLIGADPDFYLRWNLRRQAAPGFDFPPEHMADYLACLRDPGVIRGICEDYRAGATCDRRFDEEDQAQRRRITAPLRALWGEAGTAAKSDPLKTWRRWAERVEGRGLPCGHFLPEEAPEAVAEDLLAFFTADD